MKRVNRFIVALFFMALVFLQLNEMAIAKVWEFQPIDTVDKGWNVRFNLDLDENSITTNNVYIMDGGKKHASVPRLVGNGREIEVIPSALYEVGKNYRLIITTSVKSKTSGKALKTPLEVPFQVIDPNEDIQATHSFTSGIITTVTVIAHPRVHRVTISGTDMHYLGNNQYMYTLLDMKPGAAVTIVGYDENNKRLKSQRYNIQ